MDQNYIIDTLKNNINRQSALDVLMDFERVLDNQNIYTYANWIDGEVVEGPHIDKYWVTVTLMYPYEKMPDPEAAKRLLKHDCKVYYAKDVLISAAKLKDPGGARAMKIEKDIWLITLEIPRKFMQELAAASLANANNDADTSAVDSAIADGDGEDNATIQS